uniref:Dynein heavy chain coiled coil stalk domain-containing protein n=1 Tax=Callorhinchus milii TaxID=7868 RepID=A0A4W3JSS5_CALMI
MVRCYIKCKDYFFYIIVELDRFKNGLKKLSEASSLIGVMQEELVALGPQIEEKSKEVEQLMEKLQRDAEAVEEIRAIVKVDEAFMAEETQIVQDYAEQATQELNEVLPVLEQAILALGALDKGDISEIRVYTSPPTLVLTVMYAVCILLQKSPTWTTAKLLLGDPSFLKQLVNLDKDNIPEKVFQSLKIYSKRSNFNPDRVGAVSTACRSLCQWVLALENYNTVKKVGAVQPKQQRVAEAKEALGIAREKLKTKQRSLNLIEDHQQSLQDLYNKTVSQKESLANRKYLATNRLIRASLLISALGEEKVRWKQFIHELDKCIKGIVGDTLLSAASITYYGVFTAQYRRRIMEEWLRLCTSSDVPISPDYTLVKDTVEKNQVRKWQNKGLPPDHYSMENAILVMKGRCWPLMIDPQGQACKWISQMEGKQLSVIAAKHPKCMKTLETAIRMGQPALLTVSMTEELDPSLRPILLKVISTRAGQDYIKIGETEVEYNRNFR